MELLLDISELSSHPNAVKKILEFSGKEKVFLFEAPMGAGKTTFIKSLCSYLGVIDTMSSPTYSIVNEYRTADNQKVFHFDLYRLNDSSELLDIGFEDYLDGKSFVFIEWPELAMPFLTSYLRIIIHTDGNNRYLRAQIFE